MKSLYFLIFLLFLFASCGEKALAPPQKNIPDTCEVKYERINSEDLKFYLTVDNRQASFDIQQEASKSPLWTPKLIKAATQIAYGNINPPLKIELHPQKTHNFYEPNHQYDFNKLCPIDLIYLDTTMKVLAFIPDYKRGGEIMFMKSQDCFLVKVEENSDKVFLALSYTHKGDLYFKILNHNGILSSPTLVDTKYMCDSISITSKGIPIQFSNTNGCLQIKNNRLEYQNIDLNNDGLLDIRFSGWRMQYCPEENWDIVPRIETDTLIDSIPIVLDFIAYQNRAKQYRWHYIDKNCCTKLTTKY